jgi:glycosyltransferase involved in cell wall biosynthesis
METKLKSVSILIPAYNEEDSIQETITKINATLENTDVQFEVIVIDDGSADATAELAQKMGANVFRHPTNGGYGRALKTGLKLANYDWCLIVDADGSYPLDKIMDLLEYIPAFDMVVGARTGKHYWGSFSKRLSRTILSKLVQYVVGTRVPDINSGMRVFKKEIALEHISRISSGFSFTTTLTLAMFLNERFVKYVPIEYFDRVGKSKVRYWIDSLRMLQILVQAIVYYNPLKLFLPICITSVLVGVVVGTVEALLGAPTQGLLFFGQSILCSLLIGATGLLTDVIQQ